jgi:hypothetical protein
MAGDLTCKHDRTPDACEDCAYVAAVEAGRIQPRTDLASRGAGLAPVLGLPEEPVAAEKKKAVTHRPK